MSEYGTDVGGRVTGEYMTAMQLRAFGKHEKLVLAEVSRPTPGPGEVLVRLAYAGVNYVDVQMRDDDFARSSAYELELPATLGMEGAGTIAACGPGVAGLAYGRRVAYCTVRGSFATYAVVPAARLVSLPDDVPFALAVTLMTAGLTAEYLTTSTYPLAASSTCLVHAAAGGVGHLLVQLAKRRGARVIATVGSAEKAAFVRELGADETIVYRDVAFGPAVRARTGGRGVDVVYDSVGIDTIAESIACTRRRGTCVLYGGSSGFVDAVSPRALAEAGSIFFTRPHLAHHLGEGQLAARASNLFVAVADGTLRTFVHGTFPLAGVNEALTILGSGATRGKLLLAIGE